MNTHQMRKLPKKTVIVISVMIAVIFSVFYVVKNLKEKKLTEVLATIGHKNIKQLKVINKIEVEDTETRYKSNVYKVMFFDNNLNKTCVGFIHKEKDSHYTKDFDCK